MNNYWGNPRNLSLAHQEMNFCFQEIDQTGRVWQPARHDNGAVTHVSWTRVKCKACNGDCVLLQSEPRVIRPNMATTADHYRATGSSSGIKWEAPGEGGSVRLLRAPALGWTAGGDIMVFAFQNQSWEIYQISSRLECGLLLLWEAGLWKLTIKSNSFKINIIINNYPKISIQTWVWIKIYLI